MLRAQTTVLASVREDSAAGLQEGPLMRWVFALLLDCEDVHDADCCRCAARRRSHS